MEFEEISAANIGVIQEIEVYEDIPGEIYLERERYLLNADEILEEMLGK